jgi:hypothetical protein
VSVLCPVCPCFIDEDSTIATAEHCILEFKKASNTHNLTQWTFININNDNINNHERKNNSGMASTLTPTEIAITSGENLISEI